MKQNNKNNSTNEDIRTYTLEEIFERRLWFLLPYYIFDYEDKLTKGKENPDVTAEILADFEGVSKRLDELPDSDDMDSFIRELLKKMINKVVGALARRSKNVVEGVNKLMGGHVLDYEAKDIRNQGRAEGRAEGREEGREELLDAAISHGMLTPEQADELRSLGASTNA